MNFKVTSTLCALAAAAMLAAAPAAQAGHCKAMINAIDPDGDNSMTKLEAAKRALGVFAAINRDGDRTLEMDEVYGRLSHAAFAHADRNKDGKLSRGEWLRRVMILFKKANNDGDRTIECDELMHGYGLGLYRMLR